MYYTERYTLLRDQEALGVTPSSQPNNASGDHEKKKEKNAKHDLLFTRFAIYHHVLGHRTVIQSLIGYRFLTIDICVHKD